MISVLIPSYNQQEFLADAIDSALNQTVKCEIIIVDDGSTDNSLEIAKKYQGVYQVKGERTMRNVQVISQVNKGLASARNTGIMWAGIDLNGNFHSDDIFCLFLDADDILLPNVVEKILEIIKQNPDVDIVAPSFRTFGTTNQDVILMKNPTIKDFKIANRIGYCAAIRKSALLEVGGYNPKMVWGAEDYDLWFDLLKRGKKLITIPEVLWLYRTKENSMWTETAKHQQEFMNQIKINHPEIWKTS